MNNNIPDKPVFFLKPDSAILRNNKPFYLPGFSKEIHFELELVVRINRLGKNIAPALASGYYHEITLGIDFTARDIQRECKAKGLPWEPAKAFDGSAVVGSFVPVNPSDIQSIHFHLQINGRTVQEGYSGNMVFPVDELISHVSEFLTLRTGDLLFTGTPAGVGPVCKNDHLQAWLGDQRILSFYVR